jgi:hypothetical protein
MQGDASLRQKVTMLVGYVYGSAATVAKATSFFGFTGIQPVNRDVFTSGAYL